MSKNKFNRYVTERKTSSNSDESMEIDTVEDTENSLEVTEDNSSVEIIKQELEESVKDVNIPKVVEELAVTNEQKLTGKEGFTPVYKVEFALNNYMEAMDVSKIINPSDGARWQYSLLTTIKEVLNAPSQEEFNKEWNTILNFFKKNSKVPALTENFIFRFPNEWPGSPAEYKIFQHLVYLIVNTYDPQTRKKNILDINLEVMTEGLAQDQKNKLVNFYIV